MPNEQINLSDALDIIAQSKADIKTSIENRDITAGEDLTEYSSKIDSIKYQGLSDNYPFIGANYITSNIIYRYYSDGSVKDINAKDVTLSVLDRPNSNAWPPRMDFQDFPDYFSAFDSLYNPNLCQVSKLVEDGHVYINPVQNPGFGWFQVKVSDNVGNQDYYKTYITPVDNSPENTYAKIQSMTINDVNVTLDDNYSDSDTSIDYNLTNPTNNWNTIVINLSFKLNRLNYVPTTNNTYERFLTNLIDSDSNDITNLISYSNDYQTITIDGSSISTDKDLTLSMNFNPCDVYDNSLQSEVPLYNWSKGIVITIHHA